jgi:phosphohistidine swiveling domain-containing protein
MHSKKSGMTFKETMPEVYAELLILKQKLEAYFLDVCDFEFTVEDGRLYVQSARVARRTPVANIRFALQFFKEGKIDFARFLERVNFEDIYALLAPKFANKKDLILVGTGLSGVPGVSTGVLELITPRLMMSKNRPAPLILVAEEVDFSLSGWVSVISGVVTRRGGITSHTATNCRGLRIPCVFGASGFEIVTGGISIPGFGKMRRGAWLTLDGNTGEIFAGRGKFVSINWREVGELVDLSRMIEEAIETGALPWSCIGKMWKINDFFFHSIPLMINGTHKIPVRRTHYVAFRPPSDKYVKGKWNALPFLDEKERYNGEMVFSLMDTLNRLLSANLGIGNHPRYVKPLWDPQRYIETNSNGDWRQFIGVKYFDIGKYVPHLHDISKISLFIDIRFPTQSRAWFLDFTNPRGESLVVQSCQVYSYRVEVNGKAMKLEALPEFYHEIRMREYR